jgi:hypothetical protein
MMFTDPPYNVEIDGHVCGLGSVRHRNFEMGEMSESEFIRFLTTFMGLAARAPASRPFQFIDPMGSRRPDSFRASSSWSTSLSRRPGCAPNP